MRIAFGCDHAAFKIRTAVLEYLKKQGYTVEDFGCDTAESCDYPDFGVPAARSVASGRNEKGVLICGTGIGMSILANKIPGIRAGLAWQEDVAKYASEHNNANVLCLPARIIPLEKLLKCLDIWLKTPFNGEPRHQKRIDKIMELDCKCG